MNKKDQTSLLNLMESGILSELKHNQQRTTQLKTWVFASCNGTDKLLPPLLTRFRDIHFKPYTEEVVVNVLDREEGVDRDIALLIADGVYNRLKSSNIRECVRIAEIDILILTDKITNEPQVKSEAFSLKNRLVIKKGYGQHDRFVLTKGEGWHAGHSLKDFGTKLSRISKMPSSVGEENAFDENWNLAVYVLDNKQLSGG